MNDRITALAQVGLSYLIIVGYFGIKIAEGLKLLAPVSNLTELVMLVAFFWFQRQRLSTEKPSA
jgi:hypothetical protein